MKKTLYLSLLSYLSFLILLALLLTACGSFPPTGNGATPTPTEQTATPTPVHADQYLIYVYKDAANVWHLQRYNTRTGQKTDIYRTDAGQITEAQISADGQRILFLTELYPAMQTNGSARLQVIERGGQGLETLYTVANGKSVRGLEWSPDQRFIAFEQDRNVYLLTVATRTTRLVVPAHGDQGFMPRTWLDTTRLYLSPFVGSELPPLNLSLLDITTMAVRQVLSLPTLGGDFDSSIDASTLYTSQYVFAMPTATGPASIEARPATGGQATTIYRSAAYAITALRVASPTWLLFIIHNTGAGNVDSSHNGLWKIKTDGTGLSRLTSEISDERTMFPTFTQYVWSTISRDGTLYAVKTVQTTGPGATASLLFGSMSGGKPAVVSTGAASTLEIVGWTTMESH